MFLLVPWLLGVLLRLYDLRVIGLARVDRTWFMSARTWVLDFALRGYFRSSQKEPLVH